MGLSYLRGNSREEFDENKAIDRDVDRLSARSVPAFYSDPPLVSQISRTCPLPTHAQVELFRRSVAQRQAELDIFLHQEDDIKRKVESARVELIRASQCRDLAVNRLYDETHAA